MTDPNPDRPRLGDLLLAAGVIQESELQLGLAEQTRWDTPLGMTLVRLGFLDEPTLIRALASQLSIPVVQLRGKRINAEVLDLIPVDLVEKYRCMPLLINGEGPSRALYLGMEDPTNVEVVEEMTTRVGMAVQPVLVGPTELDEGIHRHYHWDSTGGSDHAAVPAPLGETPNPAPLADSARSDPGSTTGGLPPLDSMRPLTEMSDEPRFGVEEPPEVALDEPEILEFADAPLVEVQPPTAAAVVGTGSTEPMLRAIAQLLIEKGIFTREELVERLRVVSSD